MLSPLESGSEADVQFFAAVTISELETFLDHSVETTSQFCLLLNAIFWEKCH